MTPRVLRRKKRSEYAKPLKTCAQCGKAFHGYLSAKLCSKECRLVWERVRGKMRRIERSAA